MMLSKLIENKRAKIWRAKVSLLATGSRRGNVPAIHPPATRLLSFNFISRAALQNTVEHKNASDKAAHTDKNVKYNKGLHFLVGKGQKLLPRRN